MPEQIINAIAVMYDNPSGFVQTPDGPTAAFPTTAGVLQDDTLASFLFVIVVDYVLRQSVDNIDHYGLLLGRRCGRLSYKHLTDLDYADDLALVAEQITSAQGASCFTRERRSESWSHTQRKKDGMHAYQSRP